MDALLYYTVNKFYDPKSFDDDHEHEQTIAFYVDSDRKLLTKTLIKTYSLFIHSNPDKKKEILDGLSKITQIYEHDINIAIEHIFHIFEDQNNTSSYNYTENLQLENRIKTVIGEDISE